MPAPSRFPPNGPPLRVRVTAPSRLHCGMLSFGQPDVPQFGGVGVMLQRPGLELECTSAPRFEVEGPLAERAADFARRIHRALGLVDLPPVRVQIRRAPPDHVGLGTGTQLGMAVAAGLHAFWQLDATNAELAIRAERGLRSAIGVHGFERGGLIVEGGKLPGEALGRLVARVALPERWRFVLIVPPHAPGLSGDAERRAFAELPAVPPATTNRLWSEVEERLLPAARAGDYATFSRALYEYGLSAGRCFAATQGGPFASPRIEQFVAAIRQQGVEGVGQSSWGPAIFALLPDEAAAMQFVATCESDRSFRDAEILISPIDNRGATIEIEPRRTAATARGRVVASARPVGPRADRLPGE